MQIVRLQEIGSLGFWGGVEHRDNDPVEKAPQPCKFEAYDKWNPCTMHSISKAGLLQLFLPERRRNPSFGLPKGV